MATTEQLEIARRHLRDPQIDGCVLRLPGQLSRSDYVAVNKALESLGGKWNRKQAGHIFPADPSAEIAAFVNGAPLRKPARTAEGYVATPADLAASITALYTSITDLPSGARVLEPSAGDGALVRAIHEANSDVDITAVEPNETRLAKIDTPDVTLVHTSFEDYAAYTSDRFDAILMNPPFSVPGRPTIWIDHVHLAYESYLQLTGLVRG